MSYNVFFSHSAVDRDWVQWITDNAANVGILMYMYEYDIQPGTYVTEKVQSAIMQCQAFVVLLTPNSAYSSYVQQEIGFAHAKGKPVIPLVQQGVSSHCLAMLTGLEYIPFNPAQPDIAVSQLLEYLGKLKQENDFGKAVLWGLGTVATLAILGSNKRQRGVM